MSTIYKVQKGDTYSSLAKKHHGRTMSKEEYQTKLEKENNNVSLQSGKTIELPWSTTHKPNPATKSSKKASKSKKVAKKHSKKKPHKKVPPKVKSNCKRCMIDSKGFICQVGDKKVIKMKGAHKSNMRGKKKYDALILHRTRSETLPGITGPAYGQFYVDKNGSIHQAASLNRRRANHIGKQIRCRASDNTAIKHELKSHLGIGTWINDSEMKKFLKNRYTSNIETNQISAIDKKIIKNILKRHNVFKYVFEEIDDYEEGTIMSEKKRKQLGYKKYSGKKYPKRYPTNASAIGIEVVGDCTNVAKGIWEPVTKAQAKSVAILYNCLTKKYNLTKDDIYTHEQIAHKTLHEGAYVWDAIKTLIHKDHQ